MAGKIFAVICIISVICSVFTGNIEHLSSAVFTGAARAVELTIGLLSMMCLWSGVLSVFRDAGVITVAAKLLSPVLKFLFPTAHKTKNGIDECAANIAANILGIGNAATPFAVSAMKKMQLDNKHSSEASDDMITLAVLNSSPISIMPITLITLRTVAESNSPSAVLVPIWICSAFGALTAVFAVKVCARIFKKQKER